MAKGKTSNSKDERSKAEGPRILTGQDILDADDLETRTVGPVPDWGGHVIIKLMDANEAERWGKQANAKDATSVTSAIAMVRACAVNPDGSKMFPAAAQIEKLAKKSMRAIRYLSDECIKFNGLDGNRRRELAAMLRTRAEHDDLDAAVVVALNELATELDGETREGAVKNG